MSHLFLSDPPRLIGALKTMRHNLGRWQPLTNKNTTPARVLSGQNHKRGEELELQPNIPVGIVAQYRPSGSAYFGVARAQPAISQDHQVGLEPG